uniref:Uncharacterized protein n=1 Tax=Panagrolaimus sp. ES5 TaxID=591445 RepID=A0AC34FZC9_9BILA
MPSSFAYSISSGYCRNDGLSMIDECSVPNRFRLSFVSCPQATKSITHDEAYECIADWNHYSTYYFAARVVGNPFNPALGDFRCFIVDQTTNRIAMSADSSCLELTALDRASVVLTYSNAERPKPSCTFPHVIRGFAAWTSVSTGNTIKINKGRWTEISRDGETVVKALCVHSEEDLFVVKKTTNCNTGISCIKVNEAYECIADWNHYSTYYFAARVVGNPFNPALGDFRCFIVDQTTNRIAMSADSSCLELTALDRASVVLTYSNAERPKPSCTFPHVIRGFAAWTSVSTGNTIKINKGRWTEISRDGETVVKALCVHSEEDLFVVKKTTNCNTGISCIKTRKHSPDVISVTSVPMAAADMELCKKLQASEKTTFSFDMLIKDDHVVKCPYEGLLFSEKCSKPLLSVGCDVSTRMNLTDICSVRLPNSKTDIAITETFVCLVEDFFVLNFG